MQDVRIGTKQLGALLLCMIPIWQTSSHKGKQDSLFYQRAVAKGFKGGEIKGGGK